MDMKIQDVIDCLRAEYSALHDLDVALDKQRDAVKAGDIESIIESAKCVSAFSERLAATQAWRKGSAVGGGEEKPKDLVQLLEGLGVATSDEVVALAREVQDKHVAVARNISINRTAIDRALEMTRATLQQFGKTFERKSYSVDPRNVQRDGIMFDALA